MTKRALAYVAAAVVLAVASFVAGGWWTRRAGTPSTQQGAAVQYSCPMHPQYTSDHAGDCPSCGMRLEPVAADGLGPRHRPGTVRVAPERQQAVGVRLGVAERVSGTRPLRTSGRVAADESATYPIVAGTSGWIRHVGPATSGTRVRKNEVLASFYAPDFVNLQQSYYASVDTAERVRTGQMQSFNANQVTQGLERQEDTLRNLGVTEAQLAEMRKKRELVQNIYVSSPVDGFVLQRNVSPGLRFDRGLEFYRIADLRRVWILADVYQQQLPFIRSGMNARVTSAQVDRPFTATISRTEPIFDEATLTLKLRLETENPDYVLKPGMFVDVELPVQLPETLAVPADAIVDSGLRKTVYVDKGDGYFEPRQVETGWRVGDRVEVTRGLMEGERIVISGTFLIDSESRMKAASQGIVGSSSEDPVCGMVVDEKRAAAAGRKVEHQGRTVHFCSDECKRRFTAEPARFGGASPERAAAAHPATPAPPGQKAAPRVVAPATGIDPVCGMKVDVAEARAAGLTSEHGGRTIPFCAESCKKAFDAEPAKYAAKPGAEQADEHEHRP